MVSKFSLGFYLAMLWVEKKNTERKRQKMNTFFDEFVQKKLNADSRFFISRLGNVNKYLVCEEKKSVFVLFRFKQSRGIWESWGRGRLFVCKASLSELSSRIDTRYILGPCSPHTDCNASSFSHQ